MKVEQALIMAGGKGTRLGMGTKSHILYKGKILLEYVVESRPVQSLVRDDEQISDRSTFISVPQKLSIKEQAVEYRCRLNHYFRGLYRKPNTFSSPVVQ
jgi:hypothetical protein